MTYEEALEIITDFRWISPKGKGHIALEIIDVQEKCQEALEKQIQKKPPNHDRNVCPNCNSKAKYGHPYEFYCCHCGQAIDWSDEE